MTILITSAEELKLKQLLFRLEGIGATLAIPTEETIREVASTGEQVRWVGVLSSTMDMCTK